MSKKSNSVNLKGIITDFNNLELASKLLSMGFLPGKEIEIIRSNFKCSYVKVGEEYFALRNSELESINLK